MPTPGHLEAGDTAGWKRALPAPQRTAFTFLELLVVIVIITLVVAMLAPAFARTRTNSKALQCLDNERQMAIGWIMYSGDNSGWLAPNSDGTIAGKTSAHPAWVAGWLDSRADVTDNTNTTMLLDHVMWPSGAFLGTYVGNDATVFKCPADRSTALQGGVAMFRARSISMNGFVGNPTRAYDGSAKYPAYHKLSQILSPAITFVILDEHPASINDGFFATAPDILYQIVDYPASYHAEAGGFSFADGHSEIHKWLDPRTMPYSLVLNVSLPGDKDVLWLSQHAVGLVVYP